MLLIKKKVKWRKSVIICQFSPFNYWLKKRMQGYLPSHQLQCDWFQSFCFCLKRNLRRCAMGTKYHRTGSIIQPAGIAHRKFITAHITIDDPYDFGITRYGEMYGGSLSSHRPPFGILCRDTDMLQIHAIGLPSLRICLCLQTDCCTSGLYLVGSHQFPIGIGTGYQCTGLIFHIGPKYPITAAAVFAVVLLFSQTLTIQQKFHLIGIRIGVQLEFSTWRTVPMRCHAVCSHLYIIPDKVLSLVHNANMYHRLFGDEETAQEPCGGL